ncbi:MAG: T9SS type A sorting domain-containing protein [Candidatus Kapaibacterium sp.]
MKYLIAFVLFSSLFFAAQKSSAMITKIDSVYADSIYGGGVINVPQSQFILGKPDSQFCQMTGVGPTIDIAFRKSKRILVQTIKANSTILVWGRKDTTKGVDSSACEITFWFDDGINAYNTQATPLVINKTGVNVIPVPGQDFTYAEITLAQNQFGKGATSYFIDAVALVEDTFPKVSVPIHSLPVNSISSYPNPFVSNTTIHFELETTGDVQLAIIDALGRETDHINAGYLENGIHEIPLAIRTPGFYFVRLFVNGQPVGSPLKITSR